jgi:hypothetical protein
MAFEATAFATYDQVPVYRRRWFFVTCMLLFIPAAVALALTGDIYVSQRGAILQYPRSQRILIAVVATLVVVGALLRARG